MEEVSCLQQLPCVQEGNCREGGVCRLTAPSYCFKHLFQILMVLYFRGESLSGIQYTPTNKVFQKLI